MRMRRLGVVLSVVTVLWASAALARPTRSATTHGAHAPVITVTEPDGIERIDWPLTFGVPWPRGVLADEHVGVQLRNGGALPVQSRSLSRWPDGSVRWLLVDTQVTLAPRQTLHLTITAAPAASAPRQSVQLREHDDRIEIDTGVLRFAVPKNRFAIAEKLLPMGGKESGPITAVLQREETPLLASTPRSVRVLERGPLRTRLQLDGAYGDGFDYIVRIEVYAGQPLVRVLHTFINRDPADSIKVPRISIDWAFTISPLAAYTAGVENGPAQSGELGPTGVTFVQFDNETWRVGDEDRAGRLAGWFSLGNGEQTAGLSARWFWEQYPQSVALSADGLRYNLWAPEAGPAAVGMGAAKTHEFVLWAGASAKAAAASATQPLVAVVDSAWIAHSGALPQAITSDVYNEHFLKEFRRAFDRYMQRNASEPWDDRGTTSCEGMFGERPRVGAYGMWNWGDWNFPKYHDETKGCDAWGNLEYDTTQVLALGFAATGDPQMSEAMTAAARHFMDVDTVHFQRRHPEWVGMNHPKNPLHFTFELGGIDLGHTWSEGLLSYYYLSGDERGLEAARGIADYLERRARGILAMANPRQVGWPQIALLAAYEATGQRSYLDAAVVYARRAMELFPPDKINHWKHGVLADALAYTHAVTHDPAIEHWLKNYAVVVHRRRQAEPRFIPGIAYVAHLTRDPQMRAAALTGVQQIDLGGWGKPFTLGGRLGFRVYSLLADSEPAAPVKAERTKAPANAARKKAPASKKRPR